MGNDGYIKVWRRLFEHPIWLNSTPEQKCILIVLMELANHTDNSWEWNGKMFTVKRGQMVTSNSKIAEACGKGVSIQNVKTALVRFKKLEFLTYESTNTGKLITIENYSKWQGDREQPNQQPNRQLTDAQPTPNRHLTTNKNDKNDKKEKNIYSDVPEDIRVAFMEWVEMRKRIKKPVVNKSTVTRALNRLDKLASTAEQKIAIINQSTDNYWQSFYELKEEPKKRAAGEPKKYKEFVPEEVTGERLSPSEQEERVKEIKERLGGLF